MAETYLRWTPVPDVVAPCAYIVLCTDPVDHTVRLCFSAVRDAPPREVVIRFGRDVMACMSHEEFAHPWHMDDSTGEVPRIGGRWGKYTFPLLEVRDSVWLATFSDSQIEDERRAVARHFRFVSLDNTVDVLTNGDATAEWVPAAP
jgi:hypothetical protein